MAVIGGITCTFIRPRGILDPQQRIKPYGEEGINGIGFEDLAQGSGVFAFQCELVGTNAEVNTWRESMSGLKAQGIISCTDDYGDTHNNLQAGDVTPIIKAPRIQDGSLKFKGIMNVSGWITE